MQTKKINNIVSIDIDCFFKCHTYARHMNYEIEPTDSWEIINFLESTGKYGIDTSVDTYVLEKVISILEEKCSGALVRIIDEHNEIIDVMKELNVKGANMYNIDFHCDAGYGNDDSSLNLENWTKFAKSERLIDKYYWLNNINSDMNSTAFSSFQIYRDCIDDINTSLLPEIDLVVICISHHFTPKKYWDSIPNTLLNALRGDLRHFQEVTPTSLPLERLKGLDDYLIDNTQPDIYRLFRMDECYGIVEKTEDCIGLSMVSFSGKGNLFCFKEVVDKLLKEYETAELYWREGIRNEVFIKRLLKSYTIISSRNGYAKIKLQEVTNE